jgi:hypothetical protein
MRDWAFPLEIAIFGRFWARLEKNEKSSDRRNHNGARAFQQRICSTHRESGSFHRAHHGLDS